MMMREKKGVVHVVSNTIYLSWSSSLIKEEGEEEEEKDWEERLRECS
tara:strand:- start:908 stop:1048 length:141 start_codon:yes stop_codon:yes gene_type:complete